MKNEIKINIIKDKQEKVVLDNPLLPKDRTIPPVVQLGVPDENGRVYPESVPLNIMRSLGHRLAGRDKMADEFMKIVANDLKKGVDKDMLDSGFLVPGEYAK